MWKCDWYNSFPAWEIEWSLMVVAFFRKRRIFDQPFLLNTFMEGHFWRYAQMTSFVFMTGLSAGWFGGLMSMSRHVLKKLTSQLPGFGHRETNSSFLWVVSIFQNLYWADSGDLVAIASDSSFYILKYNVSFRPFWFSYPTFMRNHHRFVIKSIRFTIIWD